MSVVRQMGDRRQFQRGRFLRGIISVGATVVLFAGCASSRSPYEGMGADDLWNLGVAAFEAGDWSRAIDRFDLMISLNAAHPNVPEARIYKARAYEARQEYILAIGEYQLLLDIYFASPRAPEASLGICRGFVRLSPIPQRDQSDTQRARDACARTAFEYQGLNVAVEAEALRRQMVEKLAERAYQDADFYRRRSNFLSAADMFEKVAIDYWDTSWAPAAILARHSIYRDLGWNEEMEEESLRLEYNYPDSAEARELRGNREGAAAP